MDEVKSRFNADPHWSKEILLQIALKTGLTEAQVYKWGWDQKRKKFGVEEAERMRQFDKPNGMEILVNFSMDYDIKIIWLNTFL